MVRNGADLGRGTLTITWSSVGVCESCSAVLVPAGTMGFGDTRRFHSGREYDFVTIFGLFLRRSGSGMITHSLSKWTIRVCARASTAVLDMSRFSKGVVMGRM